MRGIYLVTCLPTGEHYVGCSAHMPRRWRAHLSSLSNGKHPSLVFQSRFNEYGESGFSFQVLQKVDWRDTVDLLILEQRWMREIRPTMNAWVPADHYRTAVRRLNANDSHPQAEPEREPEQIHEPEREPEQR